MLINHSLPHDMQSEWSLLFSTRIHGLSFTSMLAKLTNKGQTVIIIEDTNSHVFGGFASESWRVGPKFIGKLLSFYCPFKGNLLSKNEICLNISVSIHVLEHIISSCFAIQRQYDGRMELLFDLSSLHKRSA